MTTRLQGDCVGEQLAKAEGVVSWTRLTEVFKWQLVNVCLEFLIPPCVSELTHSDCVEGREYKRNLHYLVQLFAHLSGNS